MSNFSYKVAVEYGVDQKKILEKVRLFWEFFIVIIIHYTNFYLVMEVSLI